MGNLHTAILCEFITKFKFISKPFNYNIHFLEVVSIVVNTFCNRLWKLWITPYRMMGETGATSSLILSFKSSIVLGRFSYTLLLIYPQRKKSQALRLGDLADHSTFHLGDIMQAGNMSLRTHIAFLLVWAVVLSCWN